MCACTCTYLSTSNPSILKMGNIDILVYDYLQSKNITITDLPVLILKTVCKCISLSTNVSKHCTTGAIYHDIAQLLLLTIIVSDKNYTISIIDKENITINR